MTQWLLCWLLFKLQHLAFQRCLSHHGWLNMENMNRSYAWENHHQVKKAEQCYLVWFMNFCSGDKAFFLWGVKMRLVHFYNRRVSVYSVVWLPDIYEAEAARSFIKTSHLCEAVLQPRWCAVLNANVMVATLPCWFSEQGCIMRPAHWIKTCRPVVLIKVAQYCSKRSYSSSRLVKWFVT